MRSTVFIATAASMLIGTAFAQYTTQSPTAQAPASKQAPADAKSNQPRAANQIPPSANDPGNSAVKTTERNTATAPVAGANSFTEGEAKARIEGRGFANVTELKKDEQGIWRGRAQKEGRPVEVALDFQGNVFPAQP